MDSSIIVYFAWYLSKSNNINGVICPFRNRTSNVFSAISFKIDKSGSAVLKKVGAGCWTILYSSSNRRKRIAMIPCGMSFLALPIKEPELAVDHTRLYNYSSSGLHEFVLCTFWKKRGSETHKAVVPGFRRKTTHPDWTWNGDVYSFGRTAEPRKKDIGPIWWCLEKEHKILSCRFFWLEELIWSVVKRRRGEEAGDIYTPRR